MLFKQAVPQPLRQKYRLYLPTTLSNAYKCVMEDNVSVRKASIQFNVPLQTLRDRVLEKVHIDTVAAGRVPILSCDEESRLVDNIKFTLGYVYTRQEVVDIAFGFAVQLNKRTVTNPFSMRWFYSFLNRLPELRLIKPRVLEQCRAQSASATGVHNYFAEIDKILDKYELKNKQHLIFDIDENGTTQCHTPPLVVEGPNLHPPAVTAGKSCTTTIIWSGSASGVACIWPLYQ